VKNLKKNILVPEIRLIAVLAFLLALSVAMIGLKISDEYKLSADAEHLALANSIADRLNAAAMLQAQARGLGATLIGSKIRSEEMVSSFIAMGEEADLEITAAIQQSEMLLSEHDNNSVYLQNMEQLKELNKELKIFRKKLLEEDADLEEWMTIVARNIEQAYRLRTVVFTPANQREALLFYNNVLRANAASLAEYAGRERALLGYHIAAGKSLDDKTLKILESYRAIVERLSNEIVFIKGLSSMPEALIQVIKTYEHKFLGEYQKVREKVYQRNSAHRKAEKNLATKLALEADLIEESIRSAFNEFMLISSEYSILQLGKMWMTGSANDIAKAQRIVEDHFVTFENRNKHAIKLRVLDEAGRERVKVEIEKGVLKRTPGAELQDKSGRKYFKNSIILQANEIYVSPFDLNMEWGEIEKPFKPVMRLAVPIYYDQEVSGVVVISFNPLDRVLNEGRIERADFNSRLLVNGEGFFLNHPEPGKRWGMMSQLNRSRFSVKNEVPAFAEEILSGREGAGIEPWAGMHIWQPIHYNPVNRDDYWVLVAAVDSVEYSVDGAEWYRRATEGIQSAMAISAVVGSLSAKAAHDVRTSSGQSIAMQYYMLALAITSFGFITIMVGLSKRAAMELQQSKNEAEKANKAKSEFLSSMSHELRTPMNAILGFSQLLASDIDAPLSKDQKENVDYIKTAGQHLLQLINQVLELSKIEAGKVDVSMEDVEVLLVIHEAIGTVQPMADQRGIKLELVDDDFEYCVIADLTRIKQVLINLISNAVKYNVPNGSVAISCGLLDSDGVRISVSDTGVGIAEDQLDSLFAPFDRLGAENSDIEGTGIGLTITKYLVKLMGGEISFESKLGVGSVFHVDLARSDLVAATGREQDETDISHLMIERSCSIVYIEDNVANIELVKKILKQHADMPLHCAIDARHGIELVKESMPDLVLLDINLPDMDGYTVLDVLKSDPKTAGIPVIALSAKAMSHDVEAGLKAGFVDYITKPINVAHFIEVIDKVINKSG